MNLVENNHKTLYHHFADPENKLNINKAKKGCKHCYGTGVAGRFLGGTRLVCCCVVRQLQEDEQSLKR